jgi:hypothetical protein
VWAAAHLRSDAGFLSGTEWYSTVLVKTKYMPNPIDVSGVKLSNGILQLEEVLARNAHDVWALQRMREGWRYGPKRDDARKEHPSLKPYEELPESERNYDRNAAIETLKSIIALGYRIEKV